jgi:hypothetical protein
MLGREYSEFDLLFLYFSIFLFLKLNPLPSFSLFSAFIGPFTS